MKNKQEKIQNKINELEKDRIHLLFFDNSLQKSWLHKPFLIFSKLFFKIKNKPPIDHVCHISRFIYDNDTGNWLARVFESTLQSGTEENDLFDKLENFKGKVYIQTLKTVDRTRAKEFELKHRNIPYSIRLAMFSGLDSKLFTSKNNFSKEASFCSWLEVLFLQDQGYDFSKVENGNPFEITPADIFLLNLGETKLFYKD